MPEFTGMTYEEAVEMIAKETGDVIDKLFDGKWDFKDFQEALEAGSVWNAAVKIPGVERAVLMAHVIARLPKYAAAAWKPLPAGTIPAA